MGKLINREVFRSGDYIFLITEFQKCFVVRVVGTDTEFVLNTQADVNDFVQYYGI